MIYSGETTVNLFGQWNPQQDIIDQFHEGIEQLGQRTKVHCIACAKAWPICTRWFGGKIAAIVDAAD